MFNNNERNLSDELPTLSLDLSDELKLKNCMLK
jgi:hypothetical protein